jgi:hypothetical protein
MTAARAKARRRKPGGDEKKENALDALLRGWGADELKLLHVITVSILLETKHLHHSTSFSRSSCPPITIIGFSR